MTKYLLDANIFIQAKNLHYGFDFCPAFWDWLKEQNAIGKLASIEKVADELYAGEDELSNWAEERGDIFFLKANEKVLPALAEVSTWANSQNYQPSAISTFLQGADYWLIAHAKAYGWTVVTHEKPENSQKKIKIPNACIGLTINFVNVYQMLRRERARFILGHQQSSAL